MIQWVLWGQLDPCFRGVRWVRLCRWDLWFQCFRWCLFDLCDPLLLYDPYDRLFLIALFCPYFRLHPYNPLDLYAQLFLLFP